MAGIVDDRADQVAVGIPGADHADIGIDRAGRLDDVRISDAGMGGRAAVAHAEAAIEHRRTLDARSGSAAGRSTGRVGGHDGVGDLAFDVGQIIGVGQRGAFIGQRADQRRGVVEFARQNHDGRTGRMRMRSADHHMVGGDPAALLNRLASRGHAGPANAQGVDPDQRHAGFAVVEHRRPHLAAVVKHLVKRLVVSAGLFHAGRGRDIAFGEAGLERRRRRRFIGPGELWNQ